MSDLPYRRYPCAADKTSNGCPFRKDTEPGEFSQCRYDALRETVGQAGAEVPLGGPVFACHKTEEGKDQVCAGWLAVCGVEHIGVRLALSMGRLPASALQPGPGWPELFETYEEMAAAQAAREGETDGR